MNNFPDSEYDWNLELSDSILEWESALRDPRLKCDRHIFENWLMHSTMRAVRYAVHGE